jgi:hypothetical protein
MALCKLDSVASRHRDNTEVRHVMNDANSNSVGSLSSCSIWECFHQ